MEAVKFYRLHPLFFKCFKKMKKLFCLILLIFIFSLSATAFGEDNMNGKVYMQGEFLDGDLLKIAVIVSDVKDPVLGTSFNLIFDQKNIEFLRYEPGDFLERGGDPFYLVKDNNLGKIIFGETLRSDDDFPSNGGIIANFYFQIINEIEFNFEFENGIISTLDTVRQDMLNIQWESLSLNREDESFIAFSSEGKNNLLKDSTLWIEKSMPFFALISALVVFKFIINFIKNKQNKRP